MTKAFSQSCLKVLLFFYDINFLNLFKNVSSFAANDHETALDTQVPVKEQNDSQPSLKI